MSSILVFQKPNQFDDYGMCTSCGWRPEYEDSHVVYSCSYRCDFIGTIYDIWLDEDGEVQCKKKNDD